MSKLTKQLPHEWMQDQLTPENIEDVYSKPLPSMWRDDRVPLGYVHPNIDVPTASAKRTLTK